MLYLLIKDMIHTDNIGKFSLEERIAYFKNKWKKEHFSLIVICVTAIKVIIRSMHWESILEVPIR